MGSNNPGKQDIKRTAQPTEPKAGGYDDGLATPGAKFDFNSAFTDAVGACAVAVVAAGDMFSLTRDKGGYAVHIRILSDDGNFDKWFDNAEAAIYRLDRLYDTAVAKRNRREPPVLIPGA